MESRTQLLIPAAAAKGCERPPKNHHGKAPCQTQSKAKLPAVHPEGASSSHGHRKYQKYTGTTSTSSQRCWISPSAHRAFSTRQRRPQQNASVSARPSALSRKDDSTLVIQMKIATLLGRDTRRWLWPPHAPHRTDRAGSCRLPTLELLAHEESGR